MAASKHQAGLRAACLLVTAAIILLLEARQRPVVANVSENVRSSHRRQLKRQRQRLLNRYQPNVTVLEETPQRVVGYLALPRGSPWCQGQPTMWFVGHQVDDRPSCQQPDGSWRQSRTTVGDANDALNYADERGNRKMDRHDCVTFDIDGDGLTDLACLVGANKGRGVGYNEIYLTLPNGTISKIADPTLGLSKYPTMRTRVATLLRGPNDSKLIFIGVQGSVPREDGQYNKHTMFESIYKPGHPERRPWFREVQARDAPWKQFQSEVVNAVAADITGNGVDDLVICQFPLPPAIMLQTANGTWTELELPQLESTASWQSVRVGDVTNDGRLDLIAVDQGPHSSKLWIFEGQRKPPYFDFENPWFELDLSYSAPDVEVLDVNDDGFMDLYVVQSDERSDYCRGEDQPTPPKNAAHDVLLVQQASGEFEIVTMDFNKRGCSSFAVRFGSDKALALANGDFGRDGINLFLEWS